MSRTSAQQVAFERDQGLCQWCLHKFQALVQADHVHHIAHRQPGSDRSQLCISLCFNCHTIHHSAFSPTKRELVVLMYYLYGYNLTEMFPSFFPFHLDFYVDRVGEAPTMK